MAQQFVQNPTYVLAAYYKGNIESAYDIAQKQFPNFQGGIKFSAEQSFVFFLRTSQGLEVVIEKGNYVVQGSDGKFFVLDATSFESQYQPSDMQVAAEKQVFEKI
jgi:hypothetical protein